MPSSSPLSFSDALQTALASVREQMPDCVLVAYCDLHSQLALRHEAGPFVPQEKLDRITREGLIASTLREDAQAAMSATSTAHAATFSIMTWSASGEIMTITKSTAAPENALLCCAPTNTDAISLRVAAETALQTLEGFV